MNGNIKLLSFMTFLFIGCMSKSHSVSKRPTIQKGGPFDFAQMKLTENPSYIELKVLGTVAFLGDSCESRLNGKCKRKLENIFPDDGFSSHCSLSPCYNFIRAEVGGEGKVWGKEDEILRLLGPIDTEEEAKLWIFINGFDVINDKGLKINKSGVKYSISASKTAGCPLVKRLYQIELNPTGQIQELSSKVQETFNGCR